MCWVSMFPHAIPSQVAAEVGELDHLRENLEKARRQGDFAHVCICTDDSVCVVALMCTCARRKGMSAKLDEVYAAALKNASEKITSLIDNTLRVFENRFAP